MRVDDMVRKCAIFIGSMGPKGFEPKGTAFLVLAAIGDREFQHLVTAAHCVIGPHDKGPLYMRVNTVEGTAEVHQISPKAWHFHPDLRQYADVAVALVHLPPDRFDVAHVGIDDMVTPNLIAELSIGAGDELFFPGLFVRHAGQGRNEPVLRAGTIAAFPEESINTDQGPMDAYLIEARSIGGHSGSPVFVNMFAPRPPIRGPLPHPMARRSDYYLLGLIRGHFRVDQMQDIVTEDGDPNSGINTGIGIVIPASKIKETINQPALDEARDESVKRYRASSGVVDDSARSEPPTKEGDEQHKERFTSTLISAVKKHPQGD